MSRRHDDEPKRMRRRPGLLGMLFHLLLLYIVLVFTGGTLQHVNHPVAVETGRLLQTITFVEPTIYWADSRGWHPLAYGLRVLAHGVDLQQLT